VRGQHADGERGTTRASRLHTALPDAATAHGAPHDLNISISARV